MIDYGYRPDGAKLLDEVHAAITRYVVMPSPEAVDAVVLWIAATHAQPAFEHAPRLSITAPEKRCGKSRLLDVVEATAHKPLAAVNATTAAVYRSIDEDDPPTLLFDEVDAIFGSKRAAEDNEDLRALLNAGHQRGRPVIRCVGPNQQVAKFPSFAMAALAGIGDLPDTIADRAVIIRMRRRAPGEQVSPFRSRRDAEPLGELRDQINEWARGYLVTLEHAEPDLPVEDRAADTWEPLVAVADLAGGTWPGRARRAATVLTAAADEADVEASLGVRMLADCRAIFAGHDAPVIASADLVTQLRQVPEAPWEPFALDPRSLARRLRPYGITSKQVRPAGGSTAQVRGYRLEDFTDAFARYLAPGEEASQPVTSSQAQLTPVTDDQPVTDTSVTDTGTVTGLSRESDDVTSGDAPPQETPADPKALGPCVACAKPTHRYGPGGNPRCTDCRGDAA